MAGRSGQGAHHVSLITTAAAVLVVSVYIGTPLVITVQNLTGSGALLVPGLLIAAGIIVLLTGIGATIWRTSRPARVSAHTKALEATAVGHRVLPIGAPPPARRGRCRTPKPPPPTPCRARPGAAVRPSPTWRPPSMTPLRCRLQGRIPVG